MPEGRSCSPRRVSRLYQVMTGKRGAAEQGERCAVAGLRGGSGPVDYSASKAGYATRPAQPASDPQLTAGLGHLRLISLAHTTSQSLAGTNTRVVS